MRTPSLLDALLPLITLAVLIAGALALFGLDALDGPIQVALVLCCAVAALIAMKNGHHVHGGPGGRARERSRR